MAYNIGDKVNVRYKNYKRGEVVPSVIIGTKAVRLMNMMRAGMSYLCCPVELIGFEHDDEEWVPEEHNKCLPHITQDEVGSLSLGRLCEGNCCKERPKLIPPPNYCGHCGEKL
jgi:hypothetical protein